MDTSDPTIQYLLQTVKDLAEANEQLLKKVQVQGENIESLKEDHMTKQKICEYVEKVINNIYPLKHGWRTVYSQEEGRMGYYNYYDNRGDHPMSSRLRWNRSEVMERDWDSFLSKHLKVTISS